MQKKIIIITILGVVVILLFIIVGIRIFSGPEDTWLCANNQWVKHGNPSAPMPTSGCGNNLIGGQKNEHECLVAAGYSWCPSTQKCQRMWEEYCEEYKDQYRGIASTTIKDFNDCVAAGNKIIENHPSRQCSANGQIFTDIEEAGALDFPISVRSPMPNEVVESPLTISGAAKGGWYFEAQFPVKLEDEQGQVIAQTAAQAQSDWMTENYVPFNAQLNFNPGNSSKGYLVLENDNPSGLPANAQSIKFPVLFKSDKTIVKVYFNNNKLDPEISCNKVFPVERTIIKTEAIGRATLEQLLAGPTEVEKADGYSTSINPDVKINSLVIDNGVAKVDFDKQIEYQVGGSCRVSAIRAQITETLKQFSTVQEVIISVAGRTEDALQP
ncbi:MAG: GerMN domain-containing protein [Candidatus Falkowbacteria bacterium]|nr:GerMN domain-containing protein [Candidatus Falkowbacteria bacterium]